MHQSLRATPNHPITPPISAKGLRSGILLTLKRRRTATAKDLAADLGVSLNAVRYHLRELETESLVQYQRKNQGVGAPAFEYQLTPAAAALFPRRYESTLNDVLDHVVRHEGRDAAVAVLRGRYESLADKLHAELVGIRPDERLGALARFLSDEGYMAEAGTAGAAGEAVLVEHNCAIQAVAERFPEICAAEARFLSQVLGAEVDRREHILSGCSACEYRVKFGATPRQPADSPDPATPAGPAESVEDGS